MSDASRTPAQSHSGHAPAIESAPRLRLTNWSVIRAVLLLWATFLALVVVVAAETPLWWLAIAAALAAMLQPLVLLLDRWVPRWLAITLVIVVVLGVVGFVGYRGVTEIANQMTQLREATVSAAADLQKSQRVGSVATELDLGARANSFFENLPVTVGGGNTGATITAAASNGAALFAIAMLTLLLMVFGQRFVTSGLAQVRSEARRTALAAAAGRGFTRTSRYIVSMLARAVVVATATTVVCSWLSVPAPTALGLWVGVWSLVPGVGIVVGSVLVALVSVLVSPAVALAVIPAALAGQAIDVIFIQKRIERASVNVGPAATLVAALAGIALYGLGGLIVFVWITVFAFAVLSEFRRTYADFDDAVLALMIQPRASL